MPQQKPYLVSFRSEGRSFVVDTGFCEFGDAVWYAAQVLQIATIPIVEARIWYEHEQSSTLLLQLTRGDQVKL